MQDGVTIRPFLKGFLSQWHPSYFTVDELNYLNAEQYMMHGKARLFDDDLIAEKIMVATNPYDHKRLGQQVRGFVQSTWNANKEAIVYRGNFAKFSQNAGLQKKLLATGDDILVEANPKDYIWGVGLAEDDPDIFEPANWRGQNLLGKILMQVREELKAAP